MRQEKFMFCHRRKRRHVGRPRNGGALAIEMLTEDAEVEIASRMRQRATVAMDQVIRRGT